MELIPCSFRSRHHAGCLRSITRAEAQIQLSPVHVREQWEVGEVPPLGLRPPFASAKSAGTLLLRFCETPPNLPSRSPGLNLTSKCQVGYVESPRVRPKSLTNTSTLGVPKPRTESSGRGND